MMWCRVCDRNTKDRIVVRIDSTWTDYRSSSNFVSPGRWQGKLAEWLKWHRVRNPKEICWIYFINKNKYFQCFENMFVCLNLKVMKNMFFKNISSKCYITFWENVSWKRFKTFLGPYKITQIKHFLKTLSAHLAKRFQNVFNTFLC